MSIVLIIVGIILESMLIVLGLALIVNSISILSTLSIFYGLLGLITGFFFIWLAYILISRVIN